jgi:hypothetical protein
MCSTKPAESQSCSFAVSTATRRARRLERAFPLRVLRFSGSSPSWLWPGSSADAAAGAPVLAGGPVEEALVDEVAAQGGDVVVVGPQDGVHLRLTDVNADLEVLDEAVEHDEALGPVDGDVGQPAVAEVGAQDAGVVGRRLAGCLVAGPGAGRCGRGGLLIIGMEENGEGVASARCTVPPLDHDFGLWIHQVVASRIFPSPTVTHRAIPDGAGAIHLVIVEPSVLRPHAVANDGALRYPMRTGTTRAWLTEPEVADLYRQRNTAIEALDQRSDRLHEDALEAIPTDDRHSNWNRLVLTSVPDSNGALGLRTGLAEARSRRGMPW